jgi:MFS family permease
VADPDARPPNARYNFILLTLDGLSFWLGMSYFSPTTILPLFVSHLSSSNLLAGAVPAIVSIAWSVPQLLGASVATQVNSRKWYIIYTAIAGRVPLMVMIALIWAFAVDYPTAALVAFFVGFGLFRAISGVNTPVYFDLVGVTIHPRDRGRFIGLNQFLGGGLGALALAAGRNVLDAYPFPDGFVICFVTGLLVSSVSLIWLLNVREPAITPVSATGRRQILAGARRILASDRRFRAYLYARALMVVAGMASAFYGIHATRELGASDGDVAVFTSILLAVQNASTLAWGAIANRVRLPNVLMGGTIVGGIASAVALAWPSVAAFAVVFALTGIAMGAVIVVDGALPLTFAEAAGEERSLYVAVTNTILSPVNLIAPLVGGALADATGFGTMYFVATVLTAGAVASVLRVVEARPTRRGVP